MSTLYVVSVTLHILAAMLWIGGMGTFALIVVPVAKRILEPEQAGRILRAVGMRFSAISIHVLGTLLVTGVVNLACRGVLPMLATAAFWRTPFGTTLAVKLALVTFVTIASVIHARDARAAGERPATKTRTRSTVLGRLTLVVSLVVVVFAVSLVRGVPLPW
ncbi:MAG: DUF4149 domain-containing protein [Deltaproteobacteria bacterium]|nr:DUF4149 domain-containing protein [Deltaproteobacteria bacterium]